MGCWDLSACNFDESALQECVDCCIYPEQNYDCDGVCLLSVDCFGICGGDAIFDACGVCDGPGPQVWYYDSNNDNIPDPNVPAYIDCDDPGLFWITPSDENIIYGCMDFMACNFDDTATINDETCIFPDYGFDCNGNCINDIDNDGICDVGDDCIDFNNDGFCDNDCQDSDGDGICDEFEIVGCMDFIACNFDDTATNSGECVYPEEDYDCDGNCIDSDFDGICDFDEVFGCIFDNACNYNPDATEYDFSCLYIVSDYLDCYGNCYFDSDSDGVCDELEISGCLDSIACNYNAFATDVEECDYISCSGCTNPWASNYDINATLDDGSCDLGPWDYTITDCNMTVLFPYDSDIFINGEPITVGDWIGAFYTDINGALVCAGSVSWTGETTNIAIWGSEENSFNGFQSGEIITWQIYDSSEDLLIPANIDLSCIGGQSSTNFYECNAICTSNSLLSGTSFSQEIMLYEGWNLWSTYIDPSDNTLESIFANIEDNITIVKDENGLVYWPLFNLNSIGSLQNGKAYQTKVYNNELLTINGSIIPHDYPIFINEGWTFLGYLHQNCYSAIDMMSPISNDINILKDSNGNVYWPIFGLNSIGDMCPGEGFQVNALTSINHTYPSIGRFGFSDVTIIETPVHYETALNTGNNMTIGLPTSAWQIMPAIGDEIAAYDESGKLIGSTTFGGENIALTVWGDDLTTNTKDGLAIGEKVTFKLWNSDMNTESTLIVTKWDAGSDEYAVDGISIASSIIISGSESANAYKLYQNEPNPFNGTTTVKFYVPEISEVMIGVYNMLGEYVAEVTNNKYNAGNHEVEFKSNDLGQGTYFLRMTTGNFTSTINMNIIR